MEEFENENNVVASIRFVIVLQLLVNLVVALVYYQNYMDFIGNNYVTDGIRYFLMVGVIDVISLGCIVYALVRNQMRIFIYTFICAVLQTSILFYNFNDDWPFPLRGIVISLVCVFLYSFLFVFPEGFMRKKQLN